MIYKPWSVNSDPETKESQAPIHKELSHKTHEMLKEAMNRNFVSILPHTENQVKDPRKQNMRKEKIKWKKYIAPRNFCRNANQENKHHNHRRRRCHKSSLRNDREKKKQKKQTKQSKQYVESLQYFSGNTLSEKGLESFRAAWGKREFGERTVEGGEEEKKVKKRKHEREVSQEED